jgi:hypothetical protein
MIMMYCDYSEITADLRRVVLEETDEKRITDVPLALCNEIIESYLRHEKELTYLSDFEIEFVKDGDKQQVMKFNSSDAALCALDELIGYDKKYTNVVAVLKQADRVIRGYYRGRWLEPAPKDAIKFKKVGV